MRSVSKIFVKLDTLGELMKDSQEWQLERAHLLYERQQLCFGDDNWDRQLERSTYSVSVQGLTVMYRKAHAAYRTQQAAQILCTFQDVIGVSVSEPEFYCNFIFCRTVYIYAVI